MSKLTLLGLPAAVKEFNGLRTITRTYKVNGSAVEIANIEAQCFLAFGTADEEFTDALLIAQRVEPISNAPSGLDVSLVRVFREFTDDTLVSVGEDVVTRDASGRETLTRTFVCLADDAEGLAPAIGAVVSGKAVQNVRIQDQGVGAQVVVTYIEAGKLGETTRTSNNGALIVKTLTYFNEVPPTPAGYVLISEQKQESEGVPTYNYTFAKGDGVVSSEVSRSHKGKLVTYRTVKLSPSGTEVPPAAPAATIGGTVVLVDSSEREEDGHVLYNYRWAEGSGIISQSVRARQDGLRTQTYVSLGTKQTPLGIVIADEEDEADGVTRYTVTCMQDKNGGDPTGTVTSFKKSVPFTYPGRAKAYSRTVPGSNKKLADVYLAPGIQTEVEATVTISYTSTNTIPELSSLYQPTEWASAHAQLITRKGQPIDINKGLRGFRADPATTVSITTPAVADPDDAGGSILGYFVYGNTTGTLKVKGGPPDPGGNTYTLDAELQPAFMGVNGTQYFRKIVVRAMIPAQPALPI